MQPEFIVSANCCDEVSLPQPSTPSTGRSVSLAIVEGVAAYVLTSAFVFFGVIVGNAVIAPCKEHVQAFGRTGFAGSCAAWDGIWYCEIVEKGYGYRPNEKSTIAFFPVYPLCAQSVRRAFGCSAEVALVTTSNCFLCSAFVVFALFLRARATRVPTSDSARMYAILAFGLFPAGLFFRMAYSESAFVFLVVVLLYAVECHAHTVLVAIVVCLAGATRSVGIPLVAVVVIGCWRGISCSRTRVMKTLVSVPIALAGFGLFVAYQWNAFDEPFAFLKVQHAFNYREVEGGLQVIINLFTFEPVRSTYTSSYPNLYWGTFPPRKCPELNMLFLNPLFFAFAAGTIILGVRKKWLAANEVIIAALLILVPYVLQGPRAGTASLGRYVSVAVPVYIVSGQLLARLPGPIAGVILSASATHLTLLSALFVRWYWIY